MPALVIFERPSTEGESKKDDKDLTLFLIIIAPFVVAMVIDTIFVGSYIPLIVVSMIGSGFLIIAITYIKNKKDV